MLIDTLAGPAGLLGLIGLSGFAGLKHPCDKGRSGGWLRVMALLGFGGLAGFWIPGVGAMGAAGSLSLWNHQSPRLAAWGRAGLSSVIGMAYLVRHLLG